MMNIGDYCVIDDVLFKIIEIKELVKLKGVYIRMTRFVNQDEIKIIKDISKYKQENEELINYLQKFNKKNYITGKILHIDSDEEYLEMSLELYKKMSAYAKGVLLKESEIKDKIIDLILEYNPDIIVLTGHDFYNKEGLKDLNNYVNTRSFVEGVKEIRRFYSKDDKLIIAGACGSNFEALIAAGANFATSVKRVNIHLYDPVIIAIKSAFTPFNRIISLSNIFKHSIIKREGIGGIETYGKMRMILWFESRKIIKKML